jgi:hypothetical protein
VVDDYGISKFARSAGELTQHQNAIPIHLGGDEFHELVVAKLGPNQVP